MSIPGISVSSSGNTQECLEGIYAFLNAQNPVEQSLAELMEQNSDAQATTSTAFEQQENNPGGTLYQLEQDAQSQNSNNSTEIATLQTQYNDESAQNQEVLQQLQAAGNMYKDSLGEIPQDQSAVTSGASGIISIQTNLSRLLQG